MHRARIRDAYLQFSTQVCEGCEVLQIAIFDDGHVEQPGAHEAFHYRSLLRLGDFCQHKVRDMRFNT